MPPDGSATDTRGPDKQPETKEAEKPLTFEQSNLGQTVKTAQDLQKNPEALAKRRKVRKPKKPEDKPDKELLEESADKLADAKRIEVKDLPDGRKAVEVDLDLSKTKDLSGFAPDVKSMSISVSTKQPDGTEKAGDVKIVTRGVHNGKIGYFLKNEKGEMVEFELPIEGTASIKIGPDDYEKWDQKRVLAEMEKEMKEAAAQIAAKTARREASGELEDELTRTDDGATGSDSVAGGGSAGGAGSGVGATSTPDVSGASSGSSTDRPSVSSRGGHGGGAPSRTPDVSGASTSSPSSSPSRRPQTDRALPEVVKGDLRTVTEKFPGNGIESPTGEKVVINRSLHEDLKDKTPEYVYYFHGDGGSIGASMPEVLAHVDTLRRAGINAILVMPEYDTSKIKTKVNNEGEEYKSYDDCWDYFKGDKFDKLANFCFSKYSSGKFNFISFSGGYRAVAAILANTSYRGKIDTITMLDSTYDDSDDPITSELIRYVQEGGHIKVVTGAGQKTPAEAGKMEEALKRNPGNGSFDFVYTGLAHGDVNRDYLAAAMRFMAQDELEKTALASGVVEPTSAPGASAKIAETSEAGGQSIVDQYFASILINFLSGAPTKHAVKGHCNYFARDLINHYWQKLTGSIPQYRKVDGSGFDNYIAHAPIDPSATASLRGKSPKDIAIADFQYLKPGHVLFLNSKGPYKGKDEIVPGTYNQLSSSNKKAADRHWLTFLGFKDGQPYFSDNRKQIYNLDFLKRYADKGRVFLNVHDPFLSERSSMAVVDGKFYFRGQMVA